MEKSGQNDLRHTHHALVTRGQSILQVMVAAGMMSIITLGTASLITSQRKETRALEEKLAALDLEKLLITTLGDGSVCRFLFTDATQAGNRSAQTFDSTSANASISLQSIPSTANAAASAIAQVGQAASPVASSLQVQSISLTGISGGPDKFTGRFEIRFNTGILVRPLRPVVVQTLIETNPASPANAKLITGCANSNPSTHYLDPPVLVMRLPGSPAAWPEDTWISPDQTLEDLGLPSDAKEIYLGMTCGQNRGLFLQSQAGQSSNIGNLLGNYPNLCLSGNNTSSAATWFLPVQYGAMNLRNFFRIAYRENGGGSRIEIWLLGWR